MRILIILLLLLFSPTAMAQADSPSKLEQTNVSGTVTALGDGHLVLRPDNSERQVVFDITIQTEAIPSESAVRVGSKVKILATHHKLIRVEVVPYAKWLKANH